MTAKDQHHLWDKYNLNESHWCQEKQELTINLSKLLGNPTSLILTSWKNGISWKNIVDGDTENHTSPFEDSGLPLGFIDHDMLQPWREQIPDIIVERLTIYRGNAFGVLNICSRYSYANELFANNPKLFWLTFMTAQKNNWNERQFVKVCSLKQTEILKAINLPAKKSALKLLHKIEAQRYAKREYQLIIKLFSLDFECLNHRATLSMALIQFIIQYPDLIHSKLINQWEGNEIKTLKEYIQDIERIVRPMELDKNAIFLQLCHCHNLKGVQRLHDKLLVQLNKQMVSFNKQRNEPIINFPAPPLTGNQYIIPIITQQQLQLEGQLQQHCVAGYDVEIVQGSYYIYQILAPERATLSLKIQNSLSGKLRLRIDQLKGYRNKQVGKETREAVLHWFNQATDQKPRKK